MAFYLKLDPLREIQVVKTQLEKARGQEGWLAPALPGLSGGKPPFLTLRFWSGVFRLIYSLAPSLPGVSL